MKKEVVERYAWSKNEIRALLIENLASQGIKIEGETSLSFTDMVAILEFWLPRMPQGERFPWGEGGKQGTRARVQTRPKGGHDGPRAKSNEAREDNGYLHPGQKKNAQI